MKDGERLYGRGDTPSVRLGVGLAAADTVEVARERARAVALAVKVTAAN